MAFQAVNNHNLEGIMQNNKKTILLFISRSNINLKKVKASFTIPKPFHLVSPQYEREPMILHLQIGDTCYNDLSELDLQLTLGPELEPRIYQNAFNTLGTPSSGTQEDC